jgi:ABC-type multidrug transport system fused ATPase/permease subunit
MGPKYAAFFAIIFFGAAVGLMPPQLYRYFIQFMQKGGDDVLFKIAAIGVSIAVCAFAASSISILAREWLRCELEAFLRRKVHRSLSETELSQLEAVQRGEWIERISSDLLQAERFLTESFPDQIKNFLMFVGAGSLFLYYSGALGLIPVGTAIGLAILNRAIHQRLRPVLNEIRGLHGEVYQRLIENFEGLRTIRSFCGEAMVEQRFDVRLKLIKSKSLKMIRSFALLIGTNELISQLAVTGILAIAFIQLRSGSITVDDALVYPFYIGVFFNSVATFSRGSHDWNQYFAKGGRLAALFYELPASASTDIQINTPITEILGIDNRIFLKDIELKYPGHERLTAPFDFNISRGEVIGIVGPSGCGKSTLLEFLAGLRPMTANNQRVLLPTTITSYVEQKPYTFEGTIAENLRFGCNVSATTQQLWEALENTSLVHFVRFSGGLDFRLQDRGENLSEGQKYRLGIARAILSDKPFLLLDEPFAALDPQSIQVIIDLINKERQRRGIVIVTHNMPPGLIFDRLIDFATPETTRQTEVVKRGSVSFCVPETV